MVELGAPAPVRRAARTTSDEVYGALVLGLRDYVAQERLRARARGGLRRDRLRPGRPGRRRRPRRRARHRRRHALPALQHGDPGRRARDRPATWAPSWSRSRSSRRWAPTTRRSTGRLEAARPASRAENLQARIRGNLMMALSNAHGWLVLTTGNKSEMSVGYATLYGDMAGGFAVIKDVPKTLVYELVRHRNAASPEPLVPAVRDRAPTVGRAAPGPARRRLAAALRGPRPDPRRLRGGRPLARRDRRRRAPTRRRRRGPARWSTAPSTSAARRRPGSSITAKAFGRDRRLPITNRFGG